MTQLSEQIKGLLEAQVDAATALTLQLRIEYDLLKANKLTSPSLEEVAAQKQDQVDRLEQANRQWQDVLNQAGVPITLDDIHAFLSQKDAEDQLGLETTFEKLSELSREIQKQNIVNGTVLNLRYQATEQLLSIMTGKEKEVVYGPEGKQTSGGGGNTIAEA